MFAGPRWHIRAYDGLRKTFVDLVLLRVLDAEPLTDLCPLDPKDDSGWHDTEYVEIWPLETLSKTQQSVIAAEYGMTKNKQGKWSWGAVSENA